jgi:WD40 repeat protein
MSRTRWRVAVLMVLCFLTIGAAVTLRQWLRRWTEAAQLGLSTAQVEDRLELAALWRKPAVKPVSTMQQVYELGGIGAMAFSHDGKHLAIAGRFRNLSIWNTADWTLAKALDLQGMALCLAFSPDDRFLYAGGQNDRDTLHCRFDWQAGKLDKAYEGHDQGVQQLAISPDGRTMISCGYIDRTVRIWDVETAKILRSLKWRGVGFVYAPKRNLLILKRDRGLGGAVVHLGEKAAEPISLNGVFADAAFSADEKFLFTFGSALQIHPADDPERVIGEKDFPEAEGRGLLAVAPDGKQIAIACTDQRIAIATLPDLKPVKKLSPLVNPLVEYDSVPAIAYSPDGQWLLAAENTRSTPRFYRVATGEEVLPAAAHGDDVIDLRFAADGRTLRSVGRDGTVCTWHTATMKMRGRYSVPGGRSIASIRPSDGRYAMCVVRGTRRQPTQVLDVESGAIVCEVPPLPPSWQGKMPLQLWEGGLTRFFWLKEPEAMFVSDGHFRRFNYLTGEVLTEGTVDINKNSALFNAFGEPTEDGTRLFDAHDGGKRTPPWTADETLLPSLEFRRLGVVDTIGNPEGPFGLVPGGKYFYIAAQIFDRQSLKRVAFKDFADGSPSALSFNADGSRYVTVVTQRRNWNEWPRPSSVSEKRRALLRVQETLTGRTLLAVPLSKPVVLSRPAPDGRQVAVALSDGTIEVWPVP